MWYEDEDYETIARLLEEDVEEDEENAILPYNLSSRPNCMMSDYPSPMGLGSYKNVY